ncbi:pro-glucagon-like [Ammospiza nelsoni]|uniref:pro-glucagon-like n=1 Tax=Ammospiza caudacuta TaxID=2857398 RepID=UPI002738EA4B|nr:pro-glucagon-like [Ammospiza caudacuta]XP_059347140.1 pro-glucagon-like [Ammospiza nelsoni]
MVRWLYLSGLVLAVLIPAGGQVAPKDLEELSRWKLLGAQNSQSFLSLIKRHSEGTFTSDFTRYLDRMKAKDFVHWLINTKRSSPWSLGAPWKDSPITCSSWIQPVAPGSSTEGFTHHP